MGYRAGQADAMQGIGIVLGRLGQHADALDHLRAHDSLGHLHHDGGRPEHARQSWHRALAIYTDLGMPEAAVISGNLQSE